MNKVIKSIFLIIAKADDYFIPTFYRVQLDNFIYRVQILIMSGYARDTHHCKFDH